MIARSFSACGTHRTKLVNALHNARSAIAAINVIDNPHNTEVQFVLKCSCVHYIPFDDNRLARAFAASIKVLMRHGP